MPRLVKLIIFQYDHTDQKPGICIHICIFLMFVLLWANECVYLSTLVNNIDCDNFLFSDEKKDLEDEEAANGPRQILPYSSMFVFGQTNP